MTFTAVLFDLFGTLVPYVGEEEFKDSLGPTARILGCSVETLEREWCSQEGFVAAVTAMKSPRQRVEELCRRTGIRADATRLLKAAESRLQAHRTWLRPRSTAIQTLATLRARGIRLGLMSVCSSEVRLLWSETRFHECFDVVTLSCETGLLKSEPTFYLQTCRQLDAEPERTLYVGDAEDELRMARQLGMTPVLARTRKKIPWDGLAVDEPSEVVELIGIRP